MTATTSHQAPCHLQDTARAASWTPPTFWKPDAAPLSRSQRVVRSALWHPVRLYARWELPRFGHVLHRWGLSNARQWIGAPTLTVREKIHGHWVRLDLSDFFQRLAYFIGCWPELEILSALKVGLRPGDCFVDGGANIGLVTMAAAGWVGQEGRVHAFEPVAAVLEGLEWHVARNALSQVTVHGVGLSDRDEMLTAQVPGWDNWGAGTLGPVPARFDGQVRIAGTARAVPGDSRLDPADSRPLFIKLDVEGFETRAVRGLSATIRARLPAVLTEVNHEMLVLNGTSYLELTSVLAAMGYGPWGLDRGGFRSRHRLRLFPLAVDQVWTQKDVLWLHPEGPHWERFRRCWE